MREVSGNHHRQSQQRPDGLEAVSQVGITTARQFWVAAAKREEAEGFIVHADEKRTAFLELQAAIHRRFEPQMESHA